ncbi:hypothetical protein OS493_039324, partial [Desmophyllum pertusum]
EYHLPNQPVHTVDIGIKPYHLRPHPPINRTQSSPSLYSSNLIRSPLGARRKSSASAKVPRPPTSVVNSDEGLPPGPQLAVLGPPVFSSGTSLGGSGSEKARVDVIVSKQVISVTMKPPGNDIVKDWLNMNSLIS